MARKVSVAVIMPVRNEEGSIDSAMRALARSTRLPDQIIVADGRSTDRTVERLKACKIEGLNISVVDNPSIWCGGGRNRGIEASNCDIVMFADFGNVSDPHWIENMVRPFEEDEELDVVAGLHKPLIKTDFEHCMASIHYYDYYILDNYTEEEKNNLIKGPISPGGLSVAITRELWEKVGGYPEWLKKGQDTMFARKANTLGAKAVVAWDAWTYHHMRSTPKQVFNQLYYYGKGNGQMRYISPHFIKLVVFYSTILTLMLCGFFSWFFLAAAGVLYALYYFKAGLKKVYSTNPKKRKIKYLWLTFLPLISRDLGTIMGHIAGWKDWLFVKRYKKLFIEYTKGCSNEVNALVPK